MATISEREDRGPRTYYRVRDMQRDLLLNQFLEFYRDDEQFGSQLRQLAADFADALPETEEPLYTRCLFDRERMTVAIVETGPAHPLDWDTLCTKAQYDGSLRLKALVAAIRTLAHRWGLHALPGDYGYAVAYGAVRSVADNPARNRPFLMVGKMHAYPGVDGAIPGPGRLTMPVCFESKWMPESESRAQATTRLEREFKEWVRGELARLDNAVTTGGYARLGSPTKLDEHLDWLYRRVAYRKHCWIIAQTIRDIDGSPDEIPERYVRRRTGEYAQQLGIRLSRVRAQLKYTP